MEDLTKEKLLPFVEELVKWNKKINLIGRNTLPEIWENHIKDSLSLLPYLDESKTKLFVDIGSGGGFPTIPLAILRPEYSYVVTDVIQKKLSWLDFIVSKLQLPIEVVEINPSWVMEKPCIITSRAFSTIQNIQKWAKQHTPFSEGFILLKGQPNIVKQELKEAKISDYTIIPQKKGCIIIIPQKGDKNA